MSTTNDTTPLDQLAMTLFTTRYGLTLEDSYTAAQLMARRPEAAQRALDLVARRGCSFLEAARTVAQVDSYLAA
jgi:hypothetical protein